MSYIKRCRCYQCKYALRTKYGGEEVQHHIRRNRRKTKEYLKAHTFEKINNSVLIPYQG